MPGAKLPHSILPKSLQGRNKLSCILQIEVQKGKIIYPKLLR